MTGIPPIPDDELVKRVRNLHWRLEEAVLKARGMEINAERFKWSLGKKCVSIVETEVQGRRIYILNTNDSTFYRLLKESPGKWLKPGDVLGSKPTLVYKSQTSQRIRIHGEQLGLNDAVRWGGKGGRVASSNPGCRALCLSLIKEFFKGFRHVNPEKEIPLSVGESVPKPKRQTRAKRQTARVPKRVKAIAPPDARATAPENRAIGPARPKPARAPRSSTRTVPILSSRTEIVLQETRGVSPSGRLTASTAPSVSGTASLGAKSSLPIEKSTRSQQQLLESAPVPAKGRYSAPGLDYLSRIMRILALVDLINPKSDLLARAQGAAGLIGGSASMFEAAAKSMGAWSAAGRLAAASAVSSVLFLELEIVRMVGNAYYGTHKEPIRVAALGGFSSGYAAALLGHPWPWVINHLSLRSRTADIWTRVVADVGDYEIAYNLGLERGYGVAGNLTLQAADEILQTLFAIMRAEGFEIGKLEDIFLEASVRRAGSTFRHYLLTQ